MKHNGPYIRPLGVRSAGTKEWILNGKHHREDGPAIEHPDRHQQWWLNGKRHRIGGPAIDHPNGFTEWWVNGKRHREGGPAVIHPNGYQHWYLFGKFFGRTQPDNWDDLIKLAQVEMIMES